MANANSAWGVEIGSFGIKAVRLERKGSGVKVTDFAVIPHSSVLSGPDVDVDEVVRMSLGQFVSQKIVDKQKREAADMLICLMGFDCSLQN